MYSLSSNSPLYKHKSLLESVGYVSEATNKKKLNLLTALHSNGKSTLSELAYILSMEESEITNLLRELQRERMVAITNDYVTLTKDGKKWLQRENPMVEAALRDRDYEVKNGKVYISKKNYSKVHKDYKAKDNGKPMMMAMGPKGTTLYPVEFTEESEASEPELDEASVGDKHQKKIAIDTVKNPMKGVIAGGMSEKEAIKILKNKFGYTDSQIRKLQKEETELDEAIDKKEMRQYMEKLFYSIMANSAYGENSASLAEIQDDLENDRYLKIPSKYIPAVLAKAEKDGYIRQDGANYEMTQKALKYVKAMEESANLSEARQVRSESVKEIIDDLADAYGKSNEDQGKMVQLLRGLAFSDDPKANQFMKALNKWTTQQSKKMQ